MSGAAVPTGTAEPAAAEADAHAARAAELRQAVPQWIAAASGMKDSPARNPSLPTLVGLLILILCFFVVLTGISLKDRNREAAVMASLGQAFAGAGAAPPVAGAPPEQQARKLLGDLQAQLSVKVPLVAGVAPSASDDYVLQLPRSLVFADAGPELASGFPQILDQALAALKAGPDDSPYEVEVLISAPQLDAKAVAAGAAVAGALRAAGFANGAAVVGLQSGSAETVALTIRLRPNARVAPAEQPPRQP